MDKELQLEDFNLDLYDEGNGEDDGVGVYSSVVGTNSSTSIVCATDRKSTRLNSSHNRESRMPSSA